MTRIDFHILPQDSLDERIRYTCRLVEKVFRLQHEIFIQVDDVEDAKLLDKRLWDYKPESFIPHGLQSSEESSQQSPVEIGYGQHPGNHHQVLINLSHEIPTFFSRFERVIEVVCQQPEILENTRKHYRFYQERGYPLHRHDLRATQQG